MATTPEYGFRFPDLGDGPNGPAQIQALAIDVENRIKLQNGSVDNAAALPGSGDFVGQRKLLLDTKELATWTGTSWEGYWKSYIPTITGTASPTLTTFYLLTGKAIQVEFDIVLTAALTANPTLSLPGSMTFAGAGGRAIGPVQFSDASPASSRLGAVSVSTSSTVSFSYEQSNVRTALSATAPWTWASGDAIRGEFSARIA